MHNDATIVGVILFISWYLCTKQSKRTLAVLWHHLTSQLWLALKTMKLYRGETGYFKKKSD